jgi:Trypsin-like peptidase domain
MPGHRYLRLAAAAATAVVMFAAAIPCVSADPQIRNSNDSSSPPANPNKEKTLSDAVCPVVYQLDKAPGRRGYHYIFYGNAFFINRDGYLLTAAHVLSEFRDGGQPSILLRLPSAPPRMLKVTVIATDSAHDVAILKATPNPFAGPYSVAALTLAEQKPAIGELVVAQALHPSHLKDPETFELPVAENYTATILDYHSMNLDPHAEREVPLLPTHSLDKADATRTDLFLFSHEVLRGQSGAPVASATTHQIVGIIEGRWLHPAATSATQGAAIPIPYAESLLEKNHIHWDTKP